MCFPRREESKSLCMSVLCHPIIVIVFEPKVACWHTQHVNFSELSNFSSNGKQSNTPNLQPQPQQVHLQWGGGGIWTCDRRVMLKTTFLISQPAKKRVQKFKLYSHGTSHWTFPLNRNAMSLLSFRIIFQRFEKLVGIFFLENSLFSYRLGPLKQGA